MGTVEIFTTIVQTYLLQEVHCFISSGTLLTICLAVASGIGASILLMVKANKKDDPNAQKNINICAFIFLGFLIMVGSFCIGAYAEKRYVTNYIHDNIGIYMADEYQLYLENNPDLFNTGWFAADTDIITITDPIDGDKVPQRFVVSGLVSSDIPSDAYLWVFVNFADDTHAWWPQGDELRIDNGEFSETVYIGDIDSAGEEYYVCILAVNEADNEIILRRLADQDYSAMDRPDNSVMLAKILVTRE